MKKILIIEDEDYMVFRAINKVKKFYSEEYTIEIARSVSAAKNRLELSQKRGESIELIILDIMMPSDIYTDDQTNGGLLTGWVFYDKCLKSMDCKVVVWTRYTSSFDLEWGKNVIKKIRKSGSDDEIINIIKQLN